MKAQRYVNPTWERRRQAGRCLLCGKEPPRPARTTCLACGVRQSTRKPPVLRRVRTPEHVRTNLIACCGGTLHPILVLPGTPQALIAACCRRVLGIIPTEKGQP
jgi:hypothetical protein